MDPQLLSVIGIVLGLATLITLAMRGWTIIISARSWKTVVQPRKSPPSCCT